MSENAVCVKQIGLLSARQNDADNSCIKKRSTRSKSGCLTCRIRRVKCDEAKPSCHRCTSTGRKCSGYGVQPMSKNDLITATITTATTATRNKSPVASKKKNADNNKGPLPLRPLAMRLAQQLQPYQQFTNDQEKRSFELFRTFTAHASSQLFSNEFWEHLVLQVSFEEPAIRHIVIAIGALNKRFQLQASVRTGLIPVARRQEKLQLAAELRECALVHYGKAASYTSEMIDKINRLYGGERNKKGILRDAAFMACVLFVCYENIAGNYAAATIHLQCGLRILKEAEEQHRSTSYVSTPPPMTDGAKETMANPPRSISPAPSPTQVLIRSILCRLDLQNLTFSDSQDQYLYTSRSPIHVLKQQEPPPIPHIFNKGGMTEASDRLIDEMRWLMKVGDELQGQTGSLLQVEDEARAIETTGSPGGMPDELELVEYITLLDRCRSNFIEWLGAFERTRARQTPSEYSQNQRWAKLLQIYQKTGLLFLQAGTAGEECVWDEHQVTMEKIFSLIESVIALLPSRPLTFDDIAGNNTSSNNVKDPAPSFSLDTGLIFPLFVIGSKCRDPKLRRRVAECLLNPGFQWREGRWDSCGAGSLLRRMIEIEEYEARRFSLGNNGWHIGSHGFVQRAEDIPEQARVYTVYPTANLEKRELDVKFLMRPDGQNFVFRKEKIYFAF